MPKVLAPSATASPMRPHVHACGGLLVLLCGASLAFAQGGTTPAASMKGKVVMVTGSTDGLGRQVAQSVAALGAEVIVHGRNEERGAAVVKEIEAAGGKARFYRADLAAIDQVKSLAQSVSRDYKRLDVLVNNAGVWLQGDRQVSKDGHEMHFAVNYLAGFVLTRSLLPLLTAAAPSRVVNVASAAQSPIDFDDVMLERPGRAAQGYGQSKLAQILFTMDLADELRDRKVTVVALHPATMMDTTMVRQSGMPSRSTVDEGVEAVMHLVTGSDVTTGQYYNGLKPAKAHAQASDAAARARLRQLSEQLTGMPGGR